MSKEQAELVSKMKALVMRRYGDTSLDNMRKLFDAYDMNKDGKISAGELEGLLEDAGVGNAFTRGAWIKGIIEQLDKNGDKMIDWGEFTRAIE